MDLSNIKVDKKYYFTTLSIYGSILKILSLQYFQKIELKEKTCPSYNKYSELAPIMCNSKLRFVFIN